jgi:hypothetical protein
MSANIPAESAAPPSQKMEVKGYRFYILNSVCKVGVMNKREVIVVCVYLLTILIISCAFSHIITVLSAVVTCSISD